MENWDLQAVVGGSNNNNIDMENPQFSFIDTWSFQQEDDVFMSFPEIFDTNNYYPKVGDELEELYKPFCPELNPFSSQTLISSSLLEDVVEAATEENPEGHLSPVSGTKKETQVSVNRPKSSRKNQKNKVVQHVTVDDLSLDVWAWRKYGQKPIKGSPYPRSYYRCSSSKGCLARKQVERSCSDPGTFIITYTAQHSHSHPTRRSSLAGSTRNKSSTSKRLAKNVKQPQKAPQTTILSPKLNIKLDESKQQDQVSRKVEEQAYEWGDELFQSLENFEGLFVDQFPDFNLSRELWSLNEAEN